MPITGGVVSGGPKKKKKDPWGPDILYNLASDIGEAAHGLPAGLWETTKAVAGDPWRIATGQEAKTDDIVKAVWSDYKHMYSPLLHGDLGEFWNRFEAHPLGPVLDVAAIVTGGGSLVGRASRSAVKAGVPRAIDVSRSALRKVDEAEYSDVIGRLRETQPNLADSDLAAIADNQLILKNNRRGFRDANGDLWVGDSAVLKPDGNHADSPHTRVRLTGNPVIDRRRKLWAALGNKYVNAPVVGANRRVARREKISETSQNIRERMIGTNPAKKALADLTDGEARSLAFLNMREQGLSRDEIEAFYDRSDSGAENAVGNAARAGKLEQFRSDETQRLMDLWDRGEVPENIRAAQVALRDLSQRTTGILKDQGVKVDFGERAAREARIVDEVLNGRADTDLVQAGFRAVPSAASVTEGMPEWQYPRAKLSQPSRKELRRKLQGIYNIAVFASEKVDPQTRQRTLRRLDRARKGSKSKRPKSVPSVIDYNRLVEKHGPWSQVVARWVDESGPAKSELWRRLIEDRASTAHVVGDSDLALFLAQKGIHPHDPFQNIDHSLVAEALSEYYHDRFNTGMGGEFDAEIVTIGDAMYTLGGSLAEDAADLYRRARYHDPTLNEKSTLDEIADAMVDEYVPPVGYGFQRQKEWVDTVLDGVEEYLNTGDVEAFRQSLSGLPIDDSKAAALVDYIVGAKEEAGIETVDALLDDVRSVTGDDIPVAAPRGIDEDGMVGDGRDVERLLETETRLEGTGEPKKYEASEYAYIRPHTLTRREYRNYAGKPDVKGKPASANYNKGLNLQHGFDSLEPDAVIQAFEDAKRWQDARKRFSTALRYTREIGLMEDIPPGYMILDESKVSKYVNTLQRFFDEEARVIFGDDPRFADVTSELGQWMERVSDGRTRTIIPSNVERELFGEFNNSVHFIEKLIDKPTNFWRAWTLNLRPAWITNNMIGQLSLLLATHGLWNGMRAYIGQAKHKALIDGIAPDIHSAGFFQNLRREAREAREATLMSKWGEKAQALPDFMAELNARLTDDAPRRAAFLAEIRDPVHNIMRETGMSFEDSALALLADDAVVDELVTKVLDDLVNFRDLSYAERRYVRRLVPFYAWIKGINSRVLRMMDERPDQVWAGSLLGQLGVQLNEDAIEGLPAFLQGMLRIGEPDSEGRQRIIATTGMNPFGTVGDVTGMLQSTLLGNRTFGGANPASVMGPIPKSIIESFTNKDLFYGTPVDPEGNMPFAGMFLQRYVDSFPQKRMFERLRQDQDLPAWFRNEDVPEGGLYEADWKDLLGQYFGFNTRQLKTGAVREDRAPARF